MYVPTPYGPSLLFLGDAMREYRMTSEHTIQEAKRLRDMIDEEINEDLKRRMEK